MLVSGLFELITKCRIIVRITEAMLRSVSEL